MLIAFRRVAGQDVLEAYQWYEDRSKGLGGRFLGAVQKALDFICAHPGACPVVHNEIRRARLTRFPYSVYFVIEGNIAVVIAVMHGERHPRRWQDRG